MTLSLANHHASLRSAIALPAEGMGRGRAAARAGEGSDEVAFETKPKIALGLLKQALAQNLARGFVLADTGYG